jgi:hypothetical protein
VEKPALPPWMLRRSFFCLMLLAGAVAFALAWTYPLLLSPRSHILGSGPGDNITFLWNLWWMRHAMADPSAQFFYCPLIFVPWGTSLVLHTHTALPALVGATLLRSLSLVLAQNVLIWCALAANVCAMFLLALERVKDRYAACAAAVIFAGSPFVTAHLHGHWNLIHLWPLPLLVLTFDRALTRAATVQYSALSGVLLGAAIYTDYYIALFGGVLVGLVALDRLIETAVSIGAARLRMPALALFALSLIAFTIAAAIVASGGFSVAVGSVRVLAYGATNPLRVGWISLIIGVILLWCPRLRLTWRSQDAKRVLVATAITVAVCLAGAAPLVRQALTLSASGGYATQQYTWRNAPRGVDVLTLALGSPYHPLYGSAARRLYNHFKIDPIEQIGWMGIVPVSLAFYALRRRAREASRWAMICFGALLWALGPFLCVAGTDVGLPLPQLIQRFIPILSNARMPGRAMAVAYLGLAMLAAIGISALKRSRPRAAHAVGPLMCAALLLEFLPAPFPLTRLQIPALYSSLSELGDGAILELPFGIRDGFGEQGRLDHWTLYYQTVHGRPLVGGFVARLGPTLKTRYAEAPILSSLLQLSSSRPLTSKQVARDRSLAAQLLNDWHIAAIIVRRNDASRPLRDYVTSVLPADIVSSDGQRDMFIVRRR